MKTGIEGKPEREFSIRFTERIYRFHATGLGNHSPRAEGIYEIVLFPPGAEDGEVIYIGYEPKGGSVHGVLTSILENRGGLPPEKLKVFQENIANAYFDAVSVADVESDDDMKDLTWALVNAKKPRLNDVTTQAHSGRYSDIRYKEL